MPGSGVEAAMSAAAAGLDCANCWAVCFWRPAACPMALLRSRPMLLRRASSMANSCNRSRFANTVRMPASFN